MKADVAIKVDGVSKSFILPHEKSGSIKNALLSIFSKKRGYEVQHVLQDISFEIKKGEFFGIVGRNGSGKSTLLKMLAGIYTPDKGSITVNGKLTPFIELGVGFNPELSGRDNVFLNGALLGFSREEVESMYDDIVEFAELERFMDQKLKNYSSGMQVRLAFSIAIRANTDILVLDEVLAVGDEAFQRKCFSYFDKLKRIKQTVILVTHDMGSVQRFCSRAILLSEGDLAFIGAPDKAAMQYIAQNDENYAASLKGASTNKDTEKDDFEVTILNGGDGVVSRFKESDVLIVELKWHQKNVKHAGVALITLDGKDVFSPNTYTDHMPEITSNSIKYTVKLNLSPGDYILRAAIFGRHDKDLIGRVIDGPRFLVERKSSLPTYIGATRLEHEWSYE